MKADQLPDGVPEAELLQIYVSAARDNLARMAAALERLDGFPEGGLAVIHRLSHNLKGSSLQFGFTETGELARCIEMFASKRAAGGGGLGEEDQGILREALGELSELVDEIEQEIPPHDIASIRLRLLQEAR